MDDILIYVIVGFLAQLIDGALGMAYGVSASTFLLSFGLPPATASASVHAAEVFTTGVSGLSHLRLGNVDKQVFRRLVIPGVVGAVLGAYVLTSLPASIIKPIVALYLLIMGIFVLSKALQREPLIEHHTRLEPLGWVGGFLDAIGGGGWGPIVVSTLMARGKSPRFSIGSVNLAEFFVALAATIIFILTIGLSFWKVIIGLAIGGALAAPLAAYVCRILPPRVLMFMVGVLIIILSIRTLYLTLA